MIYHGTDQEVDIITELGDERRISAAVLPESWRLSAVAVMATVSAELISIARVENVYVLTCRGVYTPDDTPARRINAQFTVP